MKKGMAITLTLSVLVLLCAALDAEGAAKKMIWRVPANFATIQEAISSTKVLAGDSIYVGPGYYAGALVTKSVEIKGIGQTIINFGPRHGSGLIMGFRFLAGSDGATLSNLTFDGVDLAVMNGAAVNDVTIDHCAFFNSVQAISNWRGNRWVVTQNEIVDLRSNCGGGIGILIGDYLGGIVENNIVAHNKISGVLHVSTNDCGGYNGSGIVLYADFRWGGAGTQAIKNNHVTKNSISLTSDTPAVVDVAAFEMTDSRNDDSLAVIFKNAVGFNDFRGTVLQIVLTPSNLDLVNSISRNFGENRGHGLSPKIFK